MYSCTSDDIQYWKIQAAMNEAITELIIVEEDKLIGSLIKQAIKHNTSYYKTDV